MHIVDIVLLFLWRVRKKIEEVVDAFNKIIKGREKPSVLCSDNGYAQFTHKMRAWKTNKNASITVRT